MGGNQSLFFENPPKKLEYINILLNYDKETTFLEKAKSYFSSKDLTRPHTKSKWCNILGKTDTNPDTREFLDTLIQKNALKQDGEKGEPPNQVPTYRLDRNQLLNVYYNSTLYNSLRDLNFETINKQEPNKKIITDF